MASPTITRPIRRRSFAGPVVLISLGILFLLGNIGVVGWHAIGLWFAHFWPLLLILWGVIKLIEYYAAQRGGYSTSGIGVGGVVLLVFLIIFGLSASIAARVGGNIQRNLGIDDSDWGDLFGSSYDYTQELEQPMKPGDTFRVADNRGDIVVSAWDQDTAKVVVTKKIVADDESKAEKMSDVWKPAIVANGNIITFEPQFSQVHASGSVFGSPLTRADLEIYVPKKTVLDLQTQHGDIKVSGVDGDVKVNSGHGDISISDINGNVSVAIHHGDFTASNITGDVSLDGSVNDSTVSHVGGTLTLNGDFFGDTTISQVAKFVRFNSSRTDMQVGSLPGDLSMESDDLRVTSSGSGFSVRTHGKNIHLENVGGDVSIENRDGDVELHAGSQSLGDVSINNRSGPVQVYLPPSAAFQLQASTHGGEIRSDFSDIKVESAGDNANANGTVGGGGKHIQLNDDEADIEIHKGVIAVSTPALAPIAPQVSPAPKAPKSPKAPKAPETPTM